MMTPQTLFKSRFLLGATDYRHLKFNLSSHLLLSLFPHLLYVVKGTKYHPWWPEASKQGDILDFPLSLELDWD